MNRMEKALQAAGWERIDVYMGHCPRWMKSIDGHYYEVLFCYEILGDEKWHWQVHPPIWQPGDGTDTSKWAEESGAIIDQTVKILCWLNTIERPEEWVD